MHSCSCNWESVANYDWVSHLFNPNSHLQTAADSSFHHNIDKNQEIGHRNCHAACYSQLGLPWIPWNPSLWIPVPPVSLYFSDDWLLVHHVNLSYSCPCWYYIWYSPCALCCFTSCFVPHPHSCNFKIINNYISQIWVYHCHH